jgi:Flp pilus assembly pilin Flp
MKTLFKTFLRNDSGAALVEYGIALLVVILVGTGTLIALAGNVNLSFGQANTAAGAAVTAGGGTAIVP